MKKLVVAAAALAAACSGGPINEDAAREKPTEELCRLLGPDYLTYPSEERAIHAELARRGARCAASGG